MSRRVVIIAVIALLGLSGAWYTLLWSPQTSSLKQARANASAAQLKESTLKAQVAALQLERAHLPALQAQLAQLNSAIPATVSIDKVIDNVSAVAVSSGVVLASFTPSQPAAAIGATGGTNSISISLAVSGTYFQLVKFVNLLNTMPRLAVVDGFNLGLPDAKGSIATSINARVFVAAAAAPTTTTTAGSTH